MLCPFCKSMLRDNPDICPYCGNTVPSQSGSSMQPNPSVRYVNPPPPPEPQRAAVSGSSSGKSPALIAVLVCSLILCIGAVVVLLVQNSGGNTPSVPRNGTEPAAEQSVVTTSAAAAAVTATSAETETVTETETTSEATTSESETTSETETEPPPPEPEEPDEQAGADLTDVMDSLLLSPKLYFGMTPEQSKKSLRPLEPLNFNPDPIDSGNGVISYEYCFEKGRAELGKCAAIALPLTMTLYFQNNKLQQVDTVIGKKDSGEIVGTGDEIQTAFNTIFDNCDSVFPDRNYSYTENRIGTDGHEYRHCFTDTGDRSAFVSTASYDNEHYYCCFQYVATKVMS